MKKLISVACLDLTGDNILVFKKGNVIHTPGDQLHSNDINDLAAAKRIVLEQVGLSIDLSKFTRIKERNVIVNDINSFEVIYICYIDMDDHKKNGKQVHDGYIAEWLTAEEFTADEPIFH